MEAIESSLPAPPSPPDRMVNPSVIKQQQKMLMMQNGGAGAIHHFKNGNNHASNGLKNGNSYVNVNQNNGQHRYFHQISNDSNDGKKFYLIG